MVTMRVRDADGGRFVDVPVPIEILQRRGRDGVVGDEGIDEQLRPAARLDLERCVSDPPQLHFFFSGVASHLTTSPCMEPTIDRCVRRSRSRDLHAYSLTHASGGITFPTQNSPKST